MPKGNLVLSTSACYCIRVDRSQAHHTYRGPESLLPIFRSSKRHRNSEHPLFDFPTARTDTSVVARPGAVQALPDIRQLVANCRPSERMTLSF
jgi:hypothetical protein